MCGYRVVFCLFVCLFGVFPLEIFSLIWRLKAIEHTYCDTGHPFITVISEDPYVTLTPIGERLAVEYAEYYFFILLKTEVCVNM